jgi:hypothetical protein
MAQSQESIITTNWKRTQPSSHFGTRNLQWYYFSVDYNLYRDNTDFSGSIFNSGNSPVAYTNPGSLYSTLVKEIQEVAGAELYFLGAPTFIQPGEFVFAVADDDGQGSTGTDLFTFESTGQYRMGGQIFFAIERFFNAIEPGFNSWTINPMVDIGEGIINIDYI